MNSAITNQSTIDCPSSLQWTPSAAQDRRTSFNVCIIALVVHGLFWLQLLFSSSVRQKSMQWIYAYLILDLLLLWRFLFVYIVRILPSDCEPNKIWASFVCFLDGAVDNYLNTLQVYILLALNFCRYVQIAYNRNVYTHHVRLLIGAHGIIYALPMLIIIQLFFDWAQLIEMARDSCDVDFTNVYARTLNVIVTFALPIGLNILVILASVHHIRLMARLRLIGHRASAREKYNQSLIIQFLAFYVVWFSLWSPNLIVYQVTSGQTGLTTIVRLLNFIEIVLDPLIVAALDVRFWQLWRRLYLKLIENCLRGCNLFARKVRPITIEPPIRTIERQGEASIWKSSNRQTSVNDRIFLPLYLWCTQEVRLWIDYSSLFWIWTLWTIVTASVKKRS